MRSLIEIFNNSKVIAVIGFSENPARPSNRIGRYLAGNSFTVYGVNPVLKGKSVDDIICYDSLINVPFKIDIVNIFRRSEFITGIVNEVLMFKVRPSVIWTQYGVIDSAAKDLALKNNIEYVENKCIMTEHQKLFL